MCKALNHKEKDSDFVVQMKKAMKNDLSKRYNEPDVKLFLHVASVLDPRFKMAIFLSEEEKLAAHAELKRFMACSAKESKLEKPNIKIEPTTSTQLPTLPDESASMDVAELSVAAPVSPPSSPAAKRQKISEADETNFFDNFFGDLIITKVDRASSLMDKIEEELKLYMSMEQVSSNTDVLSWWKPYAPKLPLMASVVKQILCVPATSTPSERAFSKAVNLITAKRALLKPQKVDMLLFLNKHLKFSS